MATVHSLPTELIQHTLSLAYPPGEDESYHGLAQTSLVHSSWRGPSQSVLTSQITFDSTCQKSLPRFVETGPNNFRSEVVEFICRPTHDVRVVLAKARAGGINHLKLATNSKQIPSKLFRLASLSNVKKLSLAVDYETNSANKTSPKTTRLQFTPWPTGLESIVLSSPVLPVPLFEHSTDTLIELDLHLIECDLGNLLESITLYCTNVEKLTLREPESIGSLRWSANITTFVANLARLTNLTLTRIWPTQLEHFLTRLGYLPQLNTLSVALWRPYEGLDRLTSDDLNAATVDWEPSLRRCVHLQAVASLRRWRVTVLFEQEGEERQAFGSYFGRRWPYRKDEMEAFVSQVAGIGIQLSFGPLDD